MAGYFDGEAFALFALIICCIIILIIYGFYLLDSYLFSKSPVYGVLGLAALAGGVWFGSSWLIGQGGSTSYNKSNFNSFGGPF